MVSPKDPRYVLWSQPQSYYNKPEAKLEPKTHLPCARCYRSFKVEKHYQMYCSDHCEKVTEAEFSKLKEDKLNTTCQDCGIKVRNPEENSCRAYCLMCLRKRARSRYKPVPEADKKPFKPKNKVPLGELIKRSENERVWNDSGWSHYLKGRKWDRI